MFSKTLAVGALAAGCVAAAAGGAYIAVRHNQGDRPGAVEARAAALPAPTDAANPASPSVPRPVAETEAVVSPAIAPTAEAPKPTAGAPKAEREPSVAAPRPAPQRDSATKTSKPAPPNREPARAQAIRTDVPAATAPPTRPTPDPVREPASVPAAREVRETIAEPPPVQPVEPPPPAQPQLEQLIVPASSVIGLRVDTPLTTEKARLEDRVDARVTRDVMADGRVAIPAGARALGTVVMVERGGKIKERARLGVRFHTLVLADGSELPISTEAIYREGESPTGDSTKKIGGATVGGAILGAIIGGKKGALIGGATGAAGGTAVVMSGDRNAATLPSGTIVTIRLAAPVGVEVEKQ